LVAIINIIILLYKFSQILHALTLQNFWMTIEGVLICNFIYSSCMTRTKKNKREGWRARGPLLALEAVLTYFYKHFSDLSAGPVEIHHFHLWLTKNRLWKLISRSGSVTPYVEIDFHMWLCYVNRLWKGLSSKYKLCFKISEKIIASSTTSSITHLCLY
jgi:hypothetical protein